jgi:hypothetical protein
MTRKALPLLTALAFSCLTLFAHAQTGQFSAYGMITVDQLSGIKSSPVLQTLSPLPCSGSTVSTQSAPCTQYNNSVHPIGFTGGVSYAFKTFGPATLSADLRGSIESDKRGAQTLSDGSGVRIYSGLGGIRATFKMPKRLFLPFAEVAAGYARSNYGVLTSAQITNNTSTFPGIPTQNNLEYHAYAGLDLRVTPLADFRFFEVGYGALQEMGSFSHTYPMYSISTGVVFHIPPRD